MPPGSDLERATTFYQPPEKQAPAKSAAPKPTKPSPEKPAGRQRVAGADETARTAIDVAPGVTADASLVPGENLDERRILEEDVERIRKIRQPFGSMTQKLALPERRGYKRHWFNDEAAKVERAKDNGWSHITGRDGQPLKRAVGTGRDKGVLYAYAMELPEVFWQEDMAAFHAKAQERMDAIKEAPARAKPGQAKRSDAGKFYNPVEDSGEAPISIVKSAT